MLTSGLRAGVKHRARRPDLTDSTIERSPCLTLLFEEVYSVAAPIIPAAATAPSASPDERRLVFFDFDPRFTVPGAHVDTGHPSQDPSFRLLAGRSSPFILDNVQNNLYV